jgi:hypothetical protein
MPPRNESMMVHQRAADKDGAGFVAERRARSHDGDGPLALS